MSVIQKVCLCQPRVASALNHRGVEREQEHYTVKASVISQDESELSCYIHLSPNWDKTFLIEADFSVDENSPTQYGQPRSIIYQNTGNCN